MTEEERSESPKRHGDREYILVIVSLVILALICVVGRRSADVSSSPTLGGLKLFFSSQRTLLPKQQLAHIRSGDKA
jgi:hypothetical protein